MGVGLWWVMGTPGKKVWREVTHNTHTHHTTQHNTTHNTTCSRPRQPKQPKQVLPFCQNTQTLCLHLRLRLRLCLHQRRNRVASACGSQQWCVQCVLGNHGTVVSVPRSSPSIASTNFQVCLVSTVARVATSVCTATAKHSSTRFVCTVTSAADTITSAVLLHNCLTPSGLIIASANYVARALTLRVKSSTSIQIQLTSTSCGHTCHTRCCVRWMAASINFRTSVP